MHVGSCMTLNIIQSFVNATKFGLQWDMVMKQLLTNTRKQKPNKQKQKHILRSRESLYMGSRLHCLVRPCANSDTKQQSMRWHLTKPNGNMCSTILRFYAPWHDSNEPYDGTPISQLNQRNQLRTSKRVQDVEIISTSFWSLSIDHSWHRHGLQGLTGVVWGTSDSS